MEQTKQYTPEEIGMEDLKDLEREAGLAYKMYLNINDAYENGDVRLSRKDVNRVYQQYLSIFDKVEKLKPPLGKDEERIPLLQHSFSRTD